MSGGQQMFEVTQLSKLGGPLSKRIYINEVGKVVSDGSACTMSAGTARRARFQSLPEVAGFISKMPPTDALALGRLRGDLDGVLHLTTQAKLASMNGTAPPNLIARTASFIRYQDGQPAFALVDIDTKGMPDAVRARVAAAGGLWSALCSVLPALATAARIVRNSTSSGLSRIDTGETFPGSNGQHIYLAIGDGADAERFLYALHDRCWLAGLGWHMVGAGGQLLDRSLVDRMVHAAERLVFEGAPVVETPLQQDQSIRAAVPHEGAVLETLEACPPLRIVEQAELKHLKAKSTDALAPERAKEREGFIVRNAKALAERTSLPLAAARRAIERQCEGVLHPGIVLPFDNQELAGVTVADVLANPANYVGETLADPLEGISYGRTKAMVMQRPDGTPWINSFAHGRTVYELRFDARAAREAIDAADDAQVADVFVQVAVGGDLDPAALEGLRDAVSDRAKIGKRTLMAKLAAAQKAQGARDAEDRRNRKAAERNDPRPQLDVPAPDAPWLPVMEALNDVMSSSKAPEPPMRDIDGVATEIRVRCVPDLHGLTSVGVNDGDAKDTRLPAPEQPLLTRMTEVRLAEAIERHIEYMNDKGCPVHLGPAFVSHYLQRSDNILPIVTSVATLPVVTVAGRLMATPGLDRDSGIVFRISPEMLALVPDPAQITDARVAAAMRFLIEEWLVDVLTDYTGKATLIAAALTIIERSLLPERPAFFVTAGRRGGGKTTALMMLLMAVTGMRPSAAAWSPNEEERRKSLFAYLLEGLPALIFDNIPRGAQLSCPHIEKAITSSLYADRRLGVSETVSVSSSTVLMFTGNNIGPKGDLASRSLQVRLEIDRADPENRPFRHPDPVGWTEANRGKILRALYTVLLGNPNRRGEPETRFKTWWRLVASAIEHATKLHAEDVAKKVAAMVEDPRDNPPIAISFRDLFLTQEQDDEEGAALVDALQALRMQADWGARGFKASDVARMLNDRSERGPGEVERCALVKEFLFPGTSPDLSVTSIAIGKRLRKHVGEPVSIGNETLILREEKEKGGGGRASSEYFVEIKTGEVGK
jgi:hypothetical protein